MSDSPEKGNELSKDTDQIIAKRIETNSDENGDSENITVNLQANSNDLSHENKRSSFDISTNKSKPINNDFLLILPKPSRGTVQQDVKNNCKILKFSSEWSHDETIKEIIRLDPKVYQNLFIFIIEIKDNKNVSSKNNKKSKNYLHTLMKSFNDFGKNRPLILQVTSKTENGTTIFYKDVKSNFFVKIKHQVNTPNNFDNFQSFFWSYMNSKAKDFENRIRTMNFNDKSVFILRFLKTLALSEDTFRDLVLKCGSYGSKNDLLALLDVPFDYESGKVESKASKCLATKYEIEDCEKSILLNAVEQSNKEIVEFIIKDCRHLINYLSFYNKFMISEAAFAANQIDHFCDFIELCDFPFPKDFNPEVVTDERLKKIIQMRDELHKAISEGDQTKILNFIHLYPTVKIAYNTTNNFSALYTALDSKMFDILCLLKSHGFNAIEYDDCEEELENQNDLITMGSAKVLQRRKNIDTALVNDQKSINSLSTKSYLHHKNISKETQTEQEDQIRHWYKEIYTTELNRLLIDIVVTCPELKLIYDFESETTESVDFARNSEGVTYTCMGWITIGAKPTSLNENRERRIIGVIAHEICHYALKMVFQNNESPYFKEDKEAERVFTEITQAIEVLSTENGDDDCFKIIASVFMFYMPEDYQAELAVRVSHIIAQLGNDQSKIAHLNEKYNQLFEYMQNYVIPHLKKFLTFNHEKVRKFNIAAGIFPSLKELEYDFENVEDTNNLNENRLAVVTTNQPKLLFLKTYQDLQKKYGVLFDTKNIFMNSKNIDNLEDFDNILSKNPNLNVFVDCSGGINETLKRFSQRNDIKFVFIAPKQNENEILKTLGDLNPSKHEINFSWNNLNTESQDKLLQTKINIRNHQVTILDLISKLDETVSKKEESYEEQITEKSSEKDQKDDISKYMDEKILNLLLNQSKMSINADFYSKTTEDDLKLSFITRRFVKFKHIATKSIYGDQMTVEKIGNMTEDDLLSSVQNEKFILLSDLAGSGKSWVFKKIAEISSEKHPQIWISRIELKELVKTFKSEQWTEPEFADFMIEKILKLTNEYQAELFKLMYGIGKVLIFFDGFDEIAPDCCEFVIKLIKSFKANGGNQLWIATRDYFEVNLQKLLEIDSVHKLQPFTEQNGVDLIASNWMLSDIDDEVYKKSMEELKTNPKFSKYQKRAQSFNQNILNMKISSIGIPQFYKIIAIVTKNRKNEIMKLTILQIYGKFVEIQFERWSYEKGEIRKKANIKIQSSSSLGFTDLHIFFAMQGFYEEFKSFCGLEFDAIDWPEEEIIACGLLNKIGDKIFFIHETFREYFAAKFIIRCLKKDEKNSHFYRFFIDFLTIPKYGIVRMFLDEAFDEETILQKTEEKVPKIAEFFYQNYSKCNSLSELFEKDQKNLVHLLRQIFEAGKYENIKEILFNSTDTICEAAKRNENCSQFLEFVFTILKSEDAKDLLMKNYKDQDNFIHLLVASNKPETIEKAFIVLEKTFNTSQLQEIVESKSMIRRNLFHTATFLSKDIKIHQFLWEYVKKIYQSNEKFLKFIKQVDNVNSNIFDNAARYSTIDIFEFMIQEVEKVESHQEVRNILSTLGVEGRNLFQSAALQNTLEFNDYLWKILTNRFNAQEILQMLRHADNYGRNIFHLIFEENSKEIVEFIWNKLQTSVEIISKVDILELLKQSDNYGCNIVHSFIRSEDKDKLEFLMNEIQSFFKAQGSLDQFKELLIQERSDKKQSILHYVAVYGRNIEFINCLWKKLHNFFGDLEDLYHFTIKKDKNENNFIHLLVAYNKPNAIKNIFGLLKETFRTDQYLKIMESKGFNGRNLLHNAAYNSKDSETVQFLWKIIRDNCDSDQVFLKFLQEVDNTKHHIFNLLVLHSTEEIFGVIKTELKQIMSPEEVNKIFGTSSLVHKNLLIDAVKQKKNLKFYDTVWEIVKSNLNSPEINPILKYKNEHGSNVLQLVFNANDIDKIKYIWDKLLESEEIVTKNEILELLRESDDFGHNIVYSLIHLHEMEKLEFLMNQIKIFFQTYSSLDHFKKLLTKQTVFDNQTILHQTVLCEDICFYEYLWEQLFNVFNNPEDFYNFTIKKDKNDNNFLHHLVRFNKPNTIEEMFKFLKKKLSADQYKEIVQSKGFNSRNLLQNAACLSKNIEAFQFLWTLFRDYYTSDEEFLKFLQEFDDEHRNIFDLAVSYSTKEIFDFMIQQLQKVASKKEIKTFLRTLGNEKRNLLQSAANLNKSVELNEYLWKIMNKYFDPHEIIELIKESDAFGEKLIVHVYFNEIPQIKELLRREIKNTLDSLNSRDFDELKNECDARVKNLLNLIKDAEKQENLENKFKKLEKKLKVEKSLKSYYRIANENEFPKDFNKIHYFAACPELEYHRKFWNHLVKHCKNSKDLEHLLLHENRLGNNYIHLIVASNTSEIIEFTLTTLRKVLSAEQFAKVVHSKHESGRNIFHTAAYESRDIKTYQVLWTFFRDYFKSDKDFFKFLKEVDSECNNVFQIASTYSTNEVYAFMSEELNKVTSPEEAKKFLDLKGFGTELQSSTGFYWFASSVNEDLPAGRVLFAGNDLDGSPIYVGRALHQGNLIPAKIIPNRRDCYLSHNGREIFKTHFEYLMGTGFTWVESSKGNIPDGAVIGGTTETGEPLAIGRARNGSVITPGKVQRSRGCILIPYGNREHSYLHYEVLVNDDLKKKQLSDNSIPTASSKHSKHISESSQQNVHKSQDYFYDDDDENETDFDLE